MVDVSLPRSAPYRSLEELQQAHVQMMKGLRSDIGPDDKDSSRKAILEFVGRVKCTGACIEGPAERQAAQNILDYWSAETVSITDVDEKDWSPERLLPFQESNALQNEASEAEKTASRLRLSKKVRLAAASRLWKDSGHDKGYLLAGSALDEAAGFAAEDRDIEALVAASRARLGVERRNIWLTLAVVALCAITAWLLLDRTANRREMARLEAERQTAIAEQTAQRSLAEIRSQAASITALTKDLKTANRSAPTEITETVPDIIVLDQARSRANAGDTKMQPDQRGAIWLGSDANPNLIDPVSGALVKPSVAVVGATYKVTKNLVLRSALPSADYLQSDSAGVVPEQTTIKLRATPQPYRRPAPAAAAKASPPPPAAGSPPTSPPSPAILIQYWAEVDVEYSAQPIVYMQYAAPANATAQALAQKLKGQGFRIPGVESSDLARGLDEIRFYYAQDRAAADRLSTALNASLKDLQLSTIQAVKVTDMTTQRGSRNFPGVLELWIDLASIK